jgi:hypothetical protein
MRPAVDARFNNEQYELAMVKERFKKLDFVLALLSSISVGYRSKFFGVMTGLRIVLDNLPLALRMSRFKRDSDHVL